MGSGGSGAGGGGAGEKKRERERDLLSLLVIFRSSLVRGVCPKVRLTNAWISRGVCVCVPGLDMFELVYLSCMAVINGAKSADEVLKILKAGYFSVVRVSCHYCYYYYLYYDHRDIALLTFPGSSILTDHHRDGVS